MAVISLGLVCTRKKFALTREFLMVGSAAASKAREYQLIAFVAATGSSQNTGGSLVTRV